MREKKFNPDLYLTHVAFGGGDGVGDGGRLGGDLCDLCRGGGKGWERGDKKKFQRGRGGTGVNYLIWNRGKLDLKLSHFN